MQMLTVTLECEDGEFISNVQIPFFKTRIEILLWGTRIFKLAHELTYREVFFYDIPLDAVR